MAPETKILTVVGARPQFVKAAVLCRAQRARPRVREILVHTGQHYDTSMSGIFFEELEIPAPDHHLGIGGGSHGEMTGAMLAAIERVLLDESPDWVLVYGDTNSTLAGALAAAKLRIPVAHVEAGLRSFNRSMPEEINRVVADHTSDLLFAPTEAAVANLRREGIPEDKIVRTGDVMLDAFIHAQARAQATSDILARLGLEPGGYTLATVHRAENTDDPDRLRGIFTGLTALGERGPVVLPLHPRTKAALERAGMTARVRDTLRVIDPIGYLDMVRLESEAGLIATDSGGVQKEAYFAGVPCLTMRDETEWVELVEVGANTLTGTDPDRIRDAGALSFGSRVTHTGLYGSGDAGSAIADRLLAPRSAP